MKTRVILDTSPLVALINKRDNYHQWAKQQWGMIKPPLLTCEAVIVESCFLLRNVDRGQERVMDFIEREIIKVTFNLNEQVNNIKQLLDRYQSVPMSLADACLVRMAELNNQSPIFTLDSDFRIYRKNQHQLLDLIIIEDK